MLYAPRALTSEDLPLGQHGEKQRLHRKVFVPINGERPDQPIRANLVARKWGKTTNDGMFWTLDVKGQRLIVQAFPNKSCVTGAKRVYCPWTGVDYFEETTMGSPCINTDDDEFSVLSLRFRMEMMETAMKRRMARSQ